MENLFSVRAKIRWMFWWCLTIIKRQPGAANATINA
jgi:hypothetical protein